MNTFSKTGNNTVQKAILYHKIDGTVDRLAEKPYVRGLIVGSVETAAKWIVFTNSVFIRSVSYGKKAAS